MLQRFVLALLMLNFAAPAFAEPIGYSCVYNENEVTVSFDEEASFMEVTNWEGSSLEGTTMRYEPADGSYVLHFLPAGISSESSMLKFNADGSIHFMFCAGCGEFVCEAR